VAPERIWCWGVTCLV